MSEVVGEAYVVLRPKADARFQAETSRILSKLSFSGISKAALASVESLTSGLRGATGAAEGQIKAIEGVSAAARSAAVFQVQEAIKVEDALLAEASGYRAVAAAAVAGSREQVAATNLAIDAEKRLTATIAASSVAAQKAAASRAAGTAGAAGAAAAGSKGGGLAALGGTAKMVVGIGAGIVALQALRKATDAVVMGGAAFETELNTFGAVTGATAAQMEDASKKAIALGQDVRLPGVGASDAAVAMTELAKGGLSVQDSLDGVKGSLELGTAANTDFGTSAGIIARNLSAFQLSGTQATKVADLLAGASIAATGEVSDMAIALQQSAAVAHGAGISIEDTVTAIAQLAKAGLVGSDAGTSLRTFMLRLLPVTNKAAAEMTKLGVKVLDARGSMLPFPQIIDSYRKALMPLSQAQRQMALNTIFGQDAIRSSTIFALGGAKAFAETAKVTTKLGQANVLTTARTKGLAGSFGALQSNLETIAIQISAKVNPSIKRFVDLVNTGLSALPATLGKIRDAFKVGGLTGGIDAIKGAFTAMTPAAKAATIAAAGLAAGVAVLVAVAFPITGTVLAIGALAVAFKVAYDHSQQFRDAVDQIKQAAIAASPVWDQLRETVATAFSGMRDVIAAAARYFAAVWSVVGHRVTIITRTFLSAVATIVTNDLRAIQGLIDVWAGLFTLNWGRAWKGLKTIASSALGNVTTVFKAWGGSLLGIWQGVWKSIEEEALRGVRAVLKVIAKIPTEFSVRTPFGKRHVGVRNPAKDALEAVQGALDNISNSRESKELASAVSRNTAAALGARTRDIASAVELPTKAAIKKIADKVTPDATDAGAHLGDALGKGMTGTISTSGQNAILALQKRLKDAVAETSRQVKEAVIGAQRNLDSLGQGLTSQLAQVVDNGPLGKVLKRLQDQLSGSQAKSQSKQLRAAIVDAQKSLATAQSSIVSTGPLDAAQQKEVSTFLKPQKTALADAKRAWADFQTQTVIGGIQDRQTTLKAQIEKRVANLTDQFNRGLISEGAFTKGIGKVLEGQSKAFVIAGRTLGTAFSLGFNDQVGGLLLQAQAIQKGRDKKGVPSFLGQGSRPDITEPLTVLGKQLAVQREIVAELRRTRQQQQAAADKAAAKAAAKAAKKKSGSSIDLSGLTVGSTG